MANALILLGCGSGGEGGDLTPPTLAPVLVVTADLGSNTARLEWTASNKTGSAGFGYRIFLDINGGGFSELSTVSGATLYSDYTPSPDPTGETYTFYIEPYNDAGPATGGGLSNEAGVVLPGESEAPILSGPSPVFATPFTLSWTAVPGATTYDLERSTDNITFTLLVNTALLEHETTESSQSYYYFRVKPLAGAFEGTISNTLTVEYIVPLPWILETGEWDDDGEWRDTSNWND